MPEETTKMIEAVDRPRMKSVMEAVMRLLVVPRWGMYVLAARFMGTDRAMMWVSEAASKKSGPWGVLYRAALYRRILRHVGIDASIGMGTVFSRPEARIGNRVYLGKWCSVGWARIHDDVHVADGVQILSGSQQHGRDVNHVMVKQVTIGCGAWIGAGAVVMADVGKNATVGAGAVVTRPVGEGEMVGGVPAKVLPRKGSAKAATVATKPSRRKPRGSTTKPQRRSPSRSKAE